MKRWISRIRFFTLHFSFLCLCVRYLRALLQSKPQTRLGSPYLCLGREGLPRGDEKKLPRQAFALGAFFATI